MVVGQVRQADGDYILVNLPDGTRCALPAWMADPAVCSRFVVGEPMASIDSLLGLRRLLSSVDSGAATKRMNEEESSDGDA